MDVEYSVKSCESICVDSTLEKIVVLVVEDMMFVD